MSNTEYKYITIPLTGNDDDLSDALNDIAKDCWNLKHSEFVDPSKGGQDNGILRCIFARVNERGDREHIGFKNKN